MLLAAMLLLKIVSSSSSGSSDDARTTRTVEQQIANLRQREVERRVEHGVRHFSKRKYIEEVNKLITLLESNDGDAAEIDRLRSYLETDTHGNLLIQEDRILRRWKQLIIDAARDAAETADRDVDADVDKLRLRELSLRRFNSLLARGNLQQAMRQLIALWRLEATEAPKRRKAIKDGTYYFGKFTTSLARDIRQGISDKNQEHGGYQFGNVIKGVARGVRINTFRKQSAEAQKAVEEDKDKF